VLLWPSIELTYLVQLPAAIATLRGADFRLPLDGARSLTRFARIIRATTPETAGYLDATQRPEYGVLCRPGDGHALQYFARRATPANAFGPYLDADKMRASLAFYAARSERDALAIVDQLGTRYVMTSARQGAHPRFYVDRLHGFDGVAPGRRRAEHMRLIAEGPAGGTPQHSAFPTTTPPPGTIPHKLFERVEGAVLEVVTTPDSEVVAEVTVRTLLGRVFDYRAVGRADAQGRARLRVPYATVTREATRPTGPYRVRFGGGEVRVDVSDADVREGRVLPVFAVVG
jgi:asparagine N-glycosylation enzyme membrane subunit Stt3